jgi:hypothetical protein
MRVWGMGTGAQEAWGVELGVADRCWEGKEARLVLTRGVGGE